MIIIGIYVDDIILAGKDTERINKVKMALSQNSKSKIFTISLGYKLFKILRTAAVSGWNNLRSQNLLLTNME